MNHLQRRSTCEGFALKPSKLDEIRGVLNGGSNFLGQSLKKTSLARSNSLQKLLHFPLRLLEHQLTVSVDIDGVSNEVGVPPYHESFRVFLA